MGKKSSQAVIFLSGEMRNQERIINRFKDSNSAYFAVEKGCTFAADNHFHLECAIGDFDSADQPSGVPAIVYPAEKDETDSELAFLYAVEAGYREIWLVAPFGGRFDHSYANLSLLEKATQKRIQLYLYDGENLVTLLSAGTYAFSSEMKYVSFFAWKKEACLSLKNFKYPLDHFILKTDTPLAISNEPFDGAECELHNGHLLCVQIEK